MNREKISQALGGISDEYIAEAASCKGKNKLKMLMALVSSAAVIALVLTAVMLSRGEGQSALSSSDIPRPSVVSNSDSTQNEININRDDLMMAVADMDIQIERYDINALSEEVLKSFEDRVCESYAEFVSRLPEGYTVEYLWSYLTRWRENGHRQEEYTPFDYRLFINTPSEGTVSMAVCGKSEPLRDCIIKCDNDMPSYIKGAEMYIYGFGSKYYVFFESGGIWYDIEAETEREEELVELIEALTE